MWTNKPFRQILLSGIFGSPKQLLSLAAMPLVTYYYASKDPKLAITYMVLMAGGLFLGQFVAMGYVPRILKRISKKNAYNGSNLIAAIPFLSVFILYLIGRENLTQPIYLVFSLILFTIGGASNGITTVLQSLMIADAVDYEEYRNGIRPDGVFFSGQTFIAKMTTGIATILSGIAYTIVGFSDAKVDEINKFIEAGGIPRLEPAYEPYLMLLFFLVSIPRPSGASCRSSPLGAIAWTTTNTPASSANSTNDATPKTARRNSTPPQSVLPERRLSHGHHSRSRRRVARPGIYVLRAVLSQKRGNRYRRVRPQRHPSERGRG
jgi:Na+/melibiose symporter-like transporter